MGISYGDKLTVITKSGEYEADSVVLATGTSRTAPKINGLREYEGHGVSYCAVCDAFFYRGKDVAVLGDGSYALHEALELLPTSNTVTILTNGKEPEFQVPQNIIVNTSIIDSIRGNDAVEEVHFQNAAGDCTGGLLQISKAVYEGARAGTEIVKYLRNNDRKNTSSFS